MSFHVGQKVVCVDASGCGCLKQGAVYTVVEISPSGFDYMIAVDCEPDCFGHTGYMSERFRPIVERKTDTSFAHEILRKVTRKDRVRA